MLDLCHLMNGNSLIRSLLCLLCCKLVLLIISGLSLVYSRKIVHPLKIPVILKPATVDGRNPAPPGTWDVKNLVNNGINYQPQQVIAGSLNHQQYVPCISLSFPDGKQYPTLQYSVSLDLLFRQQSTETVLGKR